MRAEFENGHGIYAIKNIINNKMYIGSAVNLKNRRRQHFHNLKIGKHHNRHLQSSYNKYGKENFIFIIIEYVEDINLLTTREDYYIEMYESAKSENGYNKRIISTTNLGLKRSKESRDKLSKAKKGKPLGKRSEPMSQEQRDKISAFFKGKPSWNKGIPMREESKKKLSESKKGTQVGENNPFFGKKHTEETRKKMSESHIGKKQSEETRKKKSESSSGKNNPNFGIEMSEDQKSLISKTSQGSKRSKNSTSKYVGVSFVKDRNKWSSYIKYMGKLIRLGNFILEKDAALAYNAKALELYGENAKLNIIE
jgi:group I intron endonuclease